MLAVSGDAGLVPYLIARLNDPDKAVRLAAIAGLERVTGQALGESAADWEAWWAENEGTINVAR
jgi:HEAT repeat protein